MYPAPSCKLIKDRVITLGKYGTFNANLLLGRPYYFTYEVLDKNETRSETELQIVPASDLHAEVLSESLPTPSGLDGDVEGDQIDAGSADVVGDNRLTIDDVTRQNLTMDEIEELKQADTGSGREIIAKIMQSHSALEEKTAFSLSKYTLRKRQKYMKRFTVLPLDVSSLAQWMLEEKESARIMEIREEVLGLISSWSNVHYGELDAGLEHLQPNGRMLVVDDTAGLTVAALAERMGILHPPEEALEPLMKQAEEPEVSTQSAGTQQMNGQPSPTDEMNGDNQSQRLAHGDSRRKKPKRHPPDTMSATNNTITLLHPATQPNISMLSYFSYDPSDTTNKSAAIPASEHPLHTHLKSVNFLQLTNPELDGAYEEPDIHSEDVISSWKSSQRGNYYRKRRRWERIKRVVDETRAGGFDSLVAATTMVPMTVLQHTVPLLRGGANVVVYSPNIEPLTELADLYSSGRRTAFLNMLADEDDKPPTVPSEDFPVDPRLLLAPSIQTARAKAWQVLPGRTHPMMTSRGGSEGYLFTATRVLPAEGKVQARGNFAKKRKTEEAHTNGLNAKVSKVETESTDL